MMHSIKENVYEKGDSLDKFCSGDHHMRPLGPGNYLRTEMVLQR